MKRKKILANKYEEATDEALGRVAKKQKARVCVKVRVADILEINGSGLPREEYSYALKAHFDFVFVNTQHDPLFAIEVDGAQHFNDIDTIRRDRLKNSICNHFNFPLLRIDKAYLQRVGPFASVLEWVVEMWFAGEAFYQAQDAGHIPLDEDFLPQFLLECGYIEDGKFTPINLSNITDDELITLLAEHGESIRLRYYDPFMHYSVLIRKLSQEHSFSFPDRVIGGDYTLGYGSALSYVELPNGRYIYGEARCHMNHSFLHGVDIAYELAEVDLAKKLIAFQNGQDVSCSRMKLEELITAVKKGGL